MRIVVFGATGTVGRAIVAELAQRHSVIRVSRTAGDYQADVSDLARVRSVLEAIGPVDAVICATGRVHFAPLTDMTPELFQVGIRDKLMGQVNVVLAGQKLVKDGGSFTLSTGILANEYIREGSSASMVNGALEAFVRAAAIELPRGLRINAVNASVLQEALPAYGPYFRGFEAVPASRVALAYCKSVEGAQTGQIYLVR